MNSRIIKTESEWQQELTADEYLVCRLKGTEPAFSGIYYDEKSSGRYLCKCCGVVLFDSTQKYDSGCGWPSFFDALDDKLINKTRDESHGMIRVEITCAQCDSHLGHVFDDGPAPTGLRYCVNSLSLDFEAEESL